MTMKRYYQLVTDGETADLDIYGDVTSMPWDDGDVSAASLSRRLEELGGVSQINVHINSYGGEVAEGLAIYNALRRSSAKVVTTCDGFACSIASVIFMAGDERLMSKASLLMIHNAWTSAYGANADDLRKLADDMDVITASSKAAYLDRISIPEDELTALMDAESWISPDAAVEMGFATGIETFADGGKPSQSAFAQLMGAVLPSHPSAAAEPRPARPKTEPREAAEAGPADEGAEAESSEEEQKRKSIAGVPAFLRAIAD